MNNIWAFRLALAAPAIVIAAVTIPGLENGLLLDRAFPATLYISTNAPLPIASYQEVADMLAHASSLDAETSFLQAEASIDANRPAKPIVPQVEHALTQSPLSARGWIILASLLASQDPRRAAAALTLAYDLAPDDYYQIFPRTLVAASLWRYLPDQVHRVLVKDVYGLARDPDRRDQLRTLLGKPGGPDLLDRAFAGKPDALRELHRSLVLDSLHL